MLAFYAGLSLVSAATLMYEIVLTRLLSVVSWYYLAFVAVSTAMLGMTAGALLVQLRPHWFRDESVARRLAQSTLAMAIAMPATLLTMLSIPIGVPTSIVQSIWTFAMFSAVISAPFIFSGVTIALALTRSPFPIGRVYSADLFGAAIGCAGAALILEVFDAPSAMIAISGLLFAAAGAFARYANAFGGRRLIEYAFLMVVLAVFNSIAPNGIRPTISKGTIDSPDAWQFDLWNSISRTRASKVITGAPEFMWGASRRMPPLNVQSIDIEIDNDAGTPVYRNSGTPRDVDFLRYDVTSLAYQLRNGGSTAIIGVGGGRDVMAAQLFGFKRIVGIEVNSAVIALATRRLQSFSNLDRVPGLEIHQDDGRSYLTRTPEKFDVVLASMVDTWASTSAGAMTLSENSLYTVEAWRIFYEHLKPGGVLTFTRWDAPSHEIETYRMFALGWATLLSAGVNNPADHIALIKSRMVATILVSNQPFSAEDIAAIRRIASQMEFETLYLPGQPPSQTELQRTVAARNLDDLAKLRIGLYDYSPVFDDSPFFFNSLSLTALMSRNFGNLATAETGNERALGFVFLFMIATILMLALTVFLPLTRWAESPGQMDSSLRGGIIYFIAIGLGFMLVEIGMMQQLSVLLGHPIYSLLVVLTGLTFATGIGSFLSENLTLVGNWQRRSPAFSSAIAVLIYAMVVLPAIHHAARLALPARISVALALVVPAGVMMGFCFPVGLRLIRTVRGDESLPWLWALNGAASVLGSFVAMMLSMQTSITTSVIAGAACYLAAAIALPAKSRATAHPVASER